MKTAEIFKLINLSNEEKDFVFSEDKIHICLKTGRVECILNSKFSVSYLDKNDLEKMIEKNRTLETFDENNKVEVRLPNEVDNKIWPIVVGIIGIIVTLISIIQTLAGYVNNGKCKKYIIEEEYEEVTEYDDGTTKRRTYTRRRVEIEC